MSDIFVPIGSPSVLFAVQGSNGIYYVTLHEILECMAIAEEEEGFPALPPHWKKAVYGAASAKEVLNA